VNLIGEHTDYNDGFVMPSAIGMRTRVTVSPRLERKLLIQFEEFSSPSSLIWMTHLSMLPELGTTMC
jgi:galactokinase